jgi:hypothetical protein
MPHIRELLTQNMKPVDVDSSQSNQASYRRGFVHVGALGFEPKDTNDGVGGTAPRSPHWRRPIHTRTSRRVGRTLRGLPRPFPRTGAELPHSAAADTFHSGGNFHIFGAPSRVDNSSLSPSSATSPPPPLLSSLFHSPSGAHTHSHTHSLIRDGRRDGWAVCAYVCMCTEVLRGRGKGLRESTGDSEIPRLSRRISRAG